MSPFKFWLPLPLSNKQEYNLVQGQVAQKRPRARESLNITRILLPNK